MRRPDTADTIFIFLILAFLALIYIIRDLEAAVIIPTALTAITLIAVIYPSLTLRNDLRRFWAKPHFLFYVEPSLITRIAAEALRNDEMWKPGIGHRRELQWQDLRYLIPPPRAAPNQNANAVYPGFSLILRNHGDGTLHAPVIRLIPLGMETVRPCGIIPHDGTEFEKETEAYVLYKPDGHIMGKDTLIFGCDYIQCEDRTRGGIFKYRLDIRGADQLDVWTFEFTVTIKE